MSGNLHSSRDEKKEETNMSTKAFVTSTKGNKDTSEGQGICSTN